MNSIAATLLLTYGINAGWLALVHQTKIACIDSPKIITDSDLPIVTIQLPIFNERYVAQRLVEAICKLDYPHDRLYIQVLDDSTDDTQEILQASVYKHQQLGIWIEYIHRSDRTGFKAGALQAAMSKVQGDYIAIFDADFIPDPHWLKQAIAHYLQPHTERTAVVQTRWGHINPNYSRLTDLQAVALDGHFVIDQQARWRNHYFLNFNGTAGIWRKQAILDSGGWTSDTLAEDMDLSYRAQLLGWQVIYDNNIVAFAELPVTMVAYKLQQFRWAKGGIQCAKKLLTRIWQSKYSLGVKWQATVHLTGYGAHPFMLMSVLLSIPLMVSSSMHTENIQAFKNISINLWQICVIIASFIAPYIYLTAQKDLYPKAWKHKLLSVFLLLILCSGMSYSNSKAVVAGLFNKGVNFRRTPKFNITGGGDRWVSKAYRLPFDLGAILELGLAAYSCVAIYIAVNIGWYSMVPFLTIYALGYGYVGGLTLWQYCQQLHLVKAPRVSASIY
ncbi:glycosyl transferase [Synechococcus sp. PCC 7502]|uniref:glycosyltransferase n=1 Tax=Synechococcus sp. PCC 7502 TaxID=1173263 RepID=UPI00029FCFC5|nr:glycosyltransferase [Synechococcus sp. PCC 7502]AFY73391.1 glycosyl transferase [Synechococcus sp. PCC 7502]